MAEAAMSPAARTKASAANETWEPAMDLPAWLAAALAPPGDPAAAFRAGHEALAARLEKKSAPGEPQAVRRRDLERIYPAGYEARESAGFIEGRGKGAAGEEEFIGLVGETPLAAERAWRFADAAWRANAPVTLRVFLDCASHATRLEEERIVLTEYVVDMSAALAAAAARGLAVHLTILGASREALPSFDNYRAARVADEELRLGLAP